MRKPLILITEIGAIIGIVGTAYYLVPGFSHVLVFVGNPNWQPTNAAICLILSLLCALIGGSFTSTKIACSHCNYQIDRQSRFCSACGKPVFLALPGKSREEDSNV